MQEANQNIDQIFKEYYQNHSLEPQPDLWQNIDSKLKNKQIAKSSKWLKWSIGISSAIILAVIAVLQFKTEEPKPIIENKKEILVEKKDSVIVTPVQKTEIETPKTIVKTEKVKAPKVETAKPEEKKVVETPKAVETPKVEATPKTENVVKPEEKTTVIYRTLEDELMENAVIEEQPSKKDKKNKKSE